MDLAVATGEEDDHAVVFACLTDAPRIDEVGRVVSGILSVKEIDDDGNRLNAGRVLKRGAVIGDDAHARIGKHGAVIVIGVSKFAGFARHGCRCAHGKAEKQSQSREQSQ